MPETFVRSILNGEHQTVVNQVNSGTSIRASIDPSRFGRAFADRMAFRFGSSLFGGCTPDFSGDKSDSDYDGFWANATLSLDCASGEDVLKTSVTVQDENDSLKFPKAGFFAEISETILNIGLSIGKRLSVLLSPSTMDVKISESEASFAVMTLAEFSIDPWKVTTGLDGTASYSGNIGAPKTGDTGNFGGYYKLVTSGLEKVPDVDFVVRIDGKFTMGICPGKTTVDVTTYEAIFVDGQNNTLRIDTVDCKTTATYNETVLKTW